VDVAAVVQTAALLGGTGIAVHRVVKELVGLLSRRDIESDQHVAQERRRLLKADN
jgi:hypothetical protein